MTPATRAEGERKLQERLEPAGAWGQKALELLTTHAPELDQAQRVFAMAWGAAEAARGMRRRDVYQLVRFALDTFTRYRDRPNDPLQQRPRPRP